MNYQNSEEIINYQNINSDQDNVKNLPAYEPAINENVIQCDIKIDKFTNIKHKTEEDKIICIKNSLGGGKVKLENLKDNDNMLYFTFRQTGTQQILAKGIITKNSKYSNNDIKIGKFRFNMDYLDIQEKNKENMIKKILIRFNDENDRKYFKNSILTGIEYQSKSNKDKN